MKIFNCCTTGFIARSCVGLGFLAFALAAQAANSVTVSVPTSAVDTAPGLSGSTVFSVTMNGTAGYYSSSLVLISDATTPEGSSIINLATRNNPGGSYTFSSGSLATSPFSSVQFLALDSAPGLNSANAANFVAGVTYQYVVNWTLKDAASFTDWMTDGDGNPVQYGITLNLASAAGVGGYTTQYLDINVTPVPEPAQTLAGSIVLGCGLLLGVGRRLFTKSLL